jgi:hypothetical protein
MTEPTKNHRSRWLTLAFLVLLLTGGWVGGTALFAPQGSAPAARGDGPNGAQEGDEPGEIPDAVLASLGGLIGANLHQGYLNIGIVADAVEGKLYSADEGRALLAAVAALLQATEEQIDKLPAATLQPDDRRHLELFRAALAPLKTQVAELRLYWATTSKDHAGRYQKARDDAQAALEALVGK